MEVVTTKTPYFIMRYEMAERVWGNYMPNIQAMLLVLSEKNRTLLKKAKEISNDLKGKEWPMPIAFMEKMCIFLSFDDDIPDWIYNISRGGSYLDATEEEISELRSNHEAEDIETILGIESDAFTLSITGFRKDPILEVYELPFSLMKGEI